MKLAFPVLAQPDSSTVEWIKVYFDMPSDHSVAWTDNENNDKQDLIGILISLINSAQTSIDLCIYDLENPRIGRALVRAKKRGVRVRVVTDDDNRNDAPKLDSLMWKMLRNAKITSIDDDGDVYRPDGTIQDNSLIGSSYFMHNKFAVIDAGDNNPNNDYVWTGSTNLTYTAEYNTNNVVIIKDNEIARDYTNEFNQMWGGTAATPHASKAAFHKDKRSHQQHTFFVGKTRIQVYFSPINRSKTKPDIAKRLTELIKNKANHEVDFLSFAISASYPVSRILWQKSATGKIRLKGVIDHLFYARYRNMEGMWASPEAKRGNRKILGSNELRKLHDKIIIIDGAAPEPANQGIVVTGSYNFSASADKNNDENLLIIFSGKIANQYYQAFTGVMNRASGKTSPPPPPVSPNRWYPVNSNIRDGNRFEIDVIPGFSFPVKLLGVELPHVYSGKDSSDFYAGKTRSYMKKLLKGASVQISGPYNSKPKVHHGTFRAYITVRKKNHTFALNKKVLEDGMGRCNSYYAQHPDSIKAFKNYEMRARMAGKGIWKYPDSIGTKISRLKALGNSATSLSEVLPININTANSKLLQLLPGIGPTLAGRIIKYRKLHNGFQRIEELIKIKGIGPETMQKLRPDVVVYKRY